MDAKYQDFFGSCYGKELNWTQNFNLIYKATRDGDSYDEFIEKVDGKGNVFVLVRSEQGKTFGGYRSVPF